MIAVVYWMITFISVRMSSEDKSIPFAEEPTVKSYFDFK
jgi:hypothetical protein